MPKRVKRYGVSATVMATTIGKLREMIVNLTRNSVHVHDGVTPGGFEMARADASNNQVASASQAGIISAATFTKIHVDFPAGTLLLFPQAAAPVGWTLDTTHHNKGLRLVDSAGGGAGGVTVWTDVFTDAGVGAHAITEAEMPAHVHANTLSIDNESAHVHGTSALGTDDPGTHTHSYTPPAATTTTAAGGIANATVGGSTATGADGDHTHTITGNVDAGSAHSHGISGGVSSTGGDGTHVHSLDLRLAFVDVIICAKD